MTISLFGYTFSILAVIGIFAFIVNIVTEMIKGFGVIKKIPTRITALLVSIVVVFSGMLVYLNYADIAFVWWYAVVSFFAAFIVGYLSIFGWDTLNDAWSRYVPGNKESGENTNDKK